MKRIDANLQCPACQGPLVPKALACEACRIQVEGPFQLNEFATLSPEDLHFLRIFVQCEGRVREMEPALGLSYPTIRTRLAQLKARLAPEGEKPAPAAEDSTAATLAQLERGEITFDEAMSRIKKQRGGSRTEQKN